MGKIGMKCHGGGGQEEHLLCASPGASEGRCQPFGRPANTTQHDFDFASCAGIFEARENSLGDTCTACLQGFVLKDFGERALTIG